MITKHKNLLLLLFFTLFLSHCGSPPPSTSKPSRAKAPKGAVSEMEGYASWYGGKFHGRKTASGEIYDQDKLTAAHKSLPFGTRVKVTHVDNGKSTYVVINDRGPFVKGRVIDLSREAAKQIDMLSTGTAKVRLSVQGPMNFDEKTFIIQTGSYQDPENAQMQKRDLQQALESLNVQVIDNNGYYRVHVGPYATRNKAESMLKRLRRMNFDGLILQL